MKKCTDPEGHHHSDGPPPAAGGQHGQRSDPYGGHYRRPAHLQRPPEPAGLSHRSAPLRSCCRDDILSSGYEQKVTRGPTATGSYIERTEVTQTPQGAMKVWLERGIEAVGRGIAYTDVITLTPDAASGLDAVQAEFTMTPAYDITVTLSLADSSQGNCLMTLTLSGERKQQVTIVTGGNTETGQTTVTTTTISWDTPLIEKGVTG